MSSTKAVAVVLAAGGMLFAAAVVWPHLGRTNDESCPESSPWAKRLDRLSALFRSSTPRLRARDVKWADDGCRGEDEVVVATTCGGVVRQSEAGVRKASLRLATGSKATVRVEPRPGSEALVGTIVLSSGEAKPKSLQVFSEGANLSFSCEVMGGPCRIEFLPFAD